MNKAYYGKVIKLVGLKGEIKIQTNMPESIYIGLNIFIDDIEYFVSKLRYHKKMPVVALDKINNIESSKSLLSHKVYIEMKNLLEEGEYLVSEIIGFKIISDKQIIGRVKEILFSNDAILVVDSETEKLIPFRKPFILEINKESKKIYVNLIEGM